MDYERWLEINNDELMIECAESGADRELDFDFDGFAEDRYLDLITKLITNFERACKEKAFLGAQPPELHTEIEKVYQEAHNELFNFMWS